MSERNLLLINQPNMKKKRKFLEFFNFFDITLRKKNYFGSHIKKKNMGNAQSYVWIKKGEESQEYHKVFKNVRQVFGGVKAPVAVNTDKETFVYAYVHTEKLSQFVVTSNSLDSFLHQNSLDSFLQKNSLDSLVHQTKTDTQISRRRNSSEAFKAAITLVTISRDFTREKIKEPLI